MVCVSCFNSKIDQSNKDGFQAKLVMIGGKSCFIGPLRKNELDAIKDCFLFMVKTKDLKKITTFLDNTFQIQALKFLNQNKFYSS